MTEYDKYFVPRVRKMIEQLILQARSTLPAVGRDFSCIYSEFPVNFSGLCITDVLLSIDPVPEIIADSADKRYLTLRVYKLPCPIKSVRIIFVGSSEEIMDYLNNDEYLTQRIVDAIPDLDSNLADV